MTRQRAAAWLVLLVGALWLCAGPGRVSLQAVLACQHHPGEHAHSSGGHSAPTQGPCFCDEMTGGFDLAMSPALPAPVRLPVVVTAPELPWAYPSPVPVPPSPFLALESPPPNPLA